jgi:hypothetical protein
MRFQRHYKGLTCSASAPALDWMISLNSESQESAEILSLGGRLGQDALPCFVVSLSECPRPLLKTPILMDTNL